MKPYLCSFSISAGRDTPSLLAVSLWLRAEASNCSAMIVRSNASTRARSGCEGPGSPALGDDAPDARGPRLGERSPECESESLVGREREEPRHGVLELAHVAGPRVRLHRLHERRLDLDLPHPVAIGVLPHERADERRDVLDPLAQRRDADRDDVEPVVEVLAEAARLHVGREVAVRRGDEPHVDRLRAPADLLHFARLERAQDLGLDRQRELADLVDEERAFVGLLEVPLPRLRGAGERPLRVAEQLRLRELARDRGGVEAHERLVGPARVGVERGRHHVLAGAALARDKHGDVLRRDARDHVEHAPHRRALGDDGAAELRLGA